MVVTAEETGNTWRWNSGMKEKSLPISDSMFSEDNVGFEYERDGAISSLLYWEGNGPDAQTTFIEWNNETGAGWIESTDYNDNQRACWDINFESVGC